MPHTAQQLGMVISQLVSTLLTIHKRNSYRFCTGSRVFQFHQRAETSKIYRSVLHLVSSAQRFINVQSGYNDNKQEKWFIITLDCTLQYFVFRKFPTTRFSRQKSTNINGHHCKWYHYMKAAMYTILQYGCARLNQCEIHYSAHFFSYTFKNITTVHTKTLEQRKSNLKMGSYIKSTGPAKNVGGNCLFSRSVSFGP